MSLHFLGFAMFTCCISSLLLLIPSNIFQPPTPFAQQHSGGSFTTLLKVLEVLIPLISFPYCIQLTISSLSRNRSIYSAFRMRALTLSPALCLTAGVLVLAYKDAHMEQRPATTWDTAQSCGKAHLGCQMGVDCACHYFKDCNPDGSYTGPMLRGVDHCLCEYGWTAYCSGHGQFPNTPLEKRNGIETISILDEHPGHKTLNKALNTHAYASTTAVTVVNDHGTIETLTPTTNAKGSTILATEGPHRLYHHTVHREPHTRHDHTVTETLLVDDDSTRTIHPTEVAPNAVTETVRVINHIRQTVVPVPRISTVTKVVTETVTRTFAHHHVHHEMMDTATVAQIGTEPAVPITSHLQLIHNHTLVKVIPQPPAATLVPVVSQLP